MAAYDIDALTKAAVASFTKSGDLAILMYYRAIDAYNANYFDAMGILAGPPGPLKRLLNLRDELDGADPKDIAAHDKLMPSQSDLDVIFRKMAGKLTPPKKRGRGTSNWEKATLLMSEPITMAIAEGARIELAWSWFVEAVETRMNAAEARAEEAEERGWENKFPEYEEEFAHVEQFEEPRNYMPEAGGIMNYLNGLPEDQMLDTLRIY